ncbi:MAG: hypothetical protein ACLU30_00275 [Odoribacter splanchnicus]
MPEIAKRSFLKNTEDAASKIGEDHINYDKHLKDSPGQTLLGETQTHS